MNRQSINLLALGLLMMTSCGSDAPADVTGERPQAEENALNDFKEAKAEAEAIAEADDSKILHGVWSGEEDISLHFKPGGKAGISSKLPKYDYLTKIVGSYTIEDSFLVTIKFRKPGRMDSMKMEGILEGEYLVFEQLGKQSKLKKVSEL